MKNASYPWRRPRLSILILAFALHPRCSFGQTTFNLSLTQHSVYEPNTQLVTYAYSVAKTGAPPPGSSEGTANKKAVLTAILPKGVTFVQASAACLPDCTGGPDKNVTVTCDLGSIGSMATNLSVTISGNKTQAPSPLHAASGIVSIEPEVFLEDNSASVVSNPASSGLTILTANATERCGGYGRLVRICQPDGSLPLAAPIAMEDGPSQEVLICNVPVAAVISSTASELVIRLGAWEATGEEPTRTGDIVVKGVTVAQNAFTYARRGDANGTGKFTGADAFYLNLAIFLGGPQPLNPCGGDANGNGSVTGGDAFFANIAIFLGGAMPSEAITAAACPSQRPGPPTSPDTLSLGRATGNRGGRVTVPVSISDAPGTSLDANGTRMSAFAFNVTYPPGVFTGSSVELTGPCANLPILRDFFAEGENQIAYYAHFQELKMRSPLALSPNTAGTECARITFDIDPAAKPGPVELRFDPKKTLLSSFSGQVTEETVDGHLRLQDGLVTIN